MIVGLFLCEVMDTKPRIVPVRIQMFWFGTPGDKIKRKAGWIRK
jgi:hypothetical protein